MEGKSGDDSPATRRRRKLFLVAKNELGLTDEERLELSTYLLRRDVTSWADLDDQQVGRLLDACEGWKLVQTLFDLRG